MKKHQKKQILELLALLDEAHNSIRKNLEKNNLSIAITLLEDCQNTAIAIGTSIDSIEGDGTSAVSSLEVYCEIIYTIHEQLMDGELISPSKIYKKLNKSYVDIVNKVKYDIPEMKEVVFLPYKASMWDSLESIWRKLDADPGCEAKVIPIPYYDKNPDGSFKELHYEAADFPEYVPITHYNEYDLEKKHPDEVYIHNPYDECNIITSVHPFFYSGNIKKYTDKLIYVPYFVLEEVRLEDKRAISELAHFAQVPGVMNADLVIVQSENIRRFYIESMILLTGEKGRKTLEKKIVGLGSPKIEKIIKMAEADIEIPDDWLNCIYRGNGIRKKVILYNTSISALLEDSEKMLLKMRQVFRYFRTIKDDVALLWRPHPLMKATISSMRPQLLERYLTIVNEYLQEGWGIYDDSADMDRAIILADAYYGDKSSLVTLCKAVGMPIMIQDPQMAG